MKSCVWGFLFLFSHLIFALPNDTPSEVTENSIPEFTKIIIVYMYYYKHIKKYISYIKNKILYIFNANFKQIKNIILYVFTHKFSIT